MSAAPNSPAPIAAHASTGPAFVAREHRSDGEGERPETDRQEAAGEEEIHAAALDEKAHRREDRDDGGDHGDGRVERDPRVWEVVAVEAARQRKEHGAEAEHEDEHELADQPRAIPLRRTSFHIPLFGSGDCCR